MAGLHTDHNSDRDVDREKLIRRRKVAEALLAQSQTPMGGTEYVGGVAIRRSPLEGIAKIAQAYAGTKMQERADEEAKALRERERGDIAAAIEDYQRKTTPWPGTYETVMDEQAMGGEGKMDTIRTPDFTPSAADRRSAAMGLMGRIGEPRDTAKMLVAEAMKTPELKAYKPGDVLYRDGAQVGSIPAAPKYHVVGGSLVPEPGAGGGQVAPVYTAPEKADKDAGAWSEPYQLGGAMVQKNSRTGEVRTAVSRPPVTNVNTTIRENDKKFEKEDKLRNDYTANPKVKASAEMDSAFKLIEAAYQNPSAANDLAMATKYMKILDPTSVVRESEFALAVSATGLLDKVQNYAASVLQGKKLNPAQRKDFYDSAKAINDSFQQGRAVVDQEYAEIATGYGLDPKNVIPSLRSKGTYSGPERRGLPSVDAIEAELKRRKGG